MSANGNANRNMECQRARTSVNAPSNKRADGREQLQPSQAVRGQALPQSSTGQLRVAMGLSVGCTRSLDPFRPAADSAETVEEKIYDLALSRNGGICCYSTQCGSAHIPLSPVAEGQPAICPLPPSDPGTLFARLSRRLSFEFFWLWPPRGKAC